MTIERYDFKGNPLKTIRTFTQDDTEHPDWNTITLLEGTSYTTEITYDALNRPVTLANPDDSLTHHTYDAGGLLYSVAVEDVHTLDTDIVNTIEYDAKGQRTKVQYENGTTTTYEYDEWTFRVRRICTTRASDSAVLQDLLYWYDPVGNITKQRDEAQQTRYYNNTIALPENIYTYDALYRLIQASGREHEGNGATPDGDSWNDANRIQLAHTHDETKMRPYTQYYEYDEVGNMIQQRHTTTNSTYNWTKDLTIANNTNRLTGITNLFTESYTYDNRGNLTAGMSHLTSMSYNDLNRLETVVLDANRTAYYQYDNQGQRVRKTIVNTSANTVETRKYVGNWEVYSKKTGSTTTLQRETLHISDDTGRIALVDTPTIDTLSTGEVQLLRYQYSNHLSTATLELDAGGAIVSYEEYYPYGSTSFQSGRTTAEVSRKCYRYTGKERDEETGLYYHGARYYISWLCRWSAVDPLESEYAGWSSYNYGFCNPIKWMDSTGMGPEDEQNKNLKQAQQSLDNSQKNLEKSQMMVSKAMQADALDAITNIVGDFDEAVIGIFEKGGEFIEAIENLPQLMNALETIVGNVTVPALKDNMSESQSLLALEGAKLVEKASEALLVLSKDLAAAMNGDPKALGHLIGEALPIFLTDGVANYAKGQNMIKQAKRLSKVTETIEQKTLSSVKQQVANDAGWLRFHEGVGHTIARHVGKTDAELIARLNSSSKITGATSFTSQEIAESVISSTINTNRTALNIWLRSGSSRNLVLEYSGTDVIGRGIMRGQNIVSNLTNAKIVLKPNGYGGYNILTAFPK